MKTMHLPAVLAIPLSLAQWTPTGLPGKSPPEFRATAGEWKVLTHESAGGQLYLLPQPIPAGALPRTWLKWRWSIAKFPRARPSLPFSKGEDDYALRIGVLLSDGENEIGALHSLKGAAPDQLRKASIKVSNVVFYGAVPASNGAQTEASSGACGRNPYAKEILNCLRFTAAGPAHEASAQPSSDARQGLGLSDAQAARLSVVGLWIFADSDNSNSESEATLADLRFETPDVAEPPRK